MSNDMKVIMERWERFALDEACQGSECLKEYTVRDYLNDVGQYTGFTQQIMLQLKELVNDNPDDSNLRKSVKFLTNSIAKNGASAVLGAGLGMAIGSIAGGPFGTVAGGKAGAALGALITPVVNDAASKIFSLGSAKAVEKMFNSNQVDDPPKTPQGWIFDLNDEVQNLIKGGDQDSLIYRQFREDLFEEFKTVEQGLKSAIQKAPTAKNREAILNLPINNFLRRTASQKLLQFIQNHSMTKDTITQHPDIK